MTVRAVVCTTMDGKMDAPLSWRYGGWTSREDKDRFWSMVSWCDVAIFGRLTWRDLMGTDLHLKVSALCEPWVMSRSHNLAKLDKIEITYNALQTFKLLTGRLPNYTGCKILVCGGASTYSFCRTWIDEWYITVEPVILGHGQNFMPDNGEEPFMEVFDLCSVKKTPTGTLFMDYRKVKKDG